MSEIRIIQETEYPELIRICAEAYPSMGMASPEDLRKWEQRMKAWRRELCNN